MRRAAMPGRDAPGCGGGLFRPLILAAADPPGR